jgi:hypothetical protein
MTVDECNKALDQMVLEFEQEFKTRVAARTPVDTGALQAGWVWINTDPDLPVFTNLMDYAGYVENGTPFQRPQMMVATTVLEGPEILKIAAKKAGF